MKIKIDKGVPMPAETPTVWPFPEMEVGDSFAVPADKRESVIASAYGHWNKKGDGRKFSVRVVNGEARCWRVA